MRNNETGEFELVIGNRQLLSGFFIVVLLFAVAFAMGYVVGQNSPHSNRLTPETAANAPTPVTGSDASRPEPSTAPPPAAPPQTAAVPPAESASAPPSDTAPAPDTVTQPVRETPGRAGESKAAAPPAPGAYWQAIALPQSDAEVIATGLKEKGLPVVLTPGTRNLTRVLVGPFPDKESMGKAKTDLENAGFHPFLWK